MVSWEEFQTLAVARGNNCSRMYKDECFRLGPRANLPEAYIVAPGPLASYIPLIKVMKMASNLKVKLWLCSVCS